VVSEGDITDSERAVEALRSNERRLNEALRIGRVGFIDWDLVTNEIRWSHETYRLFGHEPGKFTPTFAATMGMVPAEDRALVQGRLDAAIRGDSPFELDHRMVRPDGTVIHVHSQAEVRRDEHGKPVQMLGTLIDITERRRAEEALRESDGRLHEALRAGRIGCIDWDLVTNEVRWSPELYRIYGHVPREGFTPTIEATVAMVHPEDFAFVKGRIDAAICGERDYEVDHRMVRPDGQVIHVHATGVVTRDAQGKPLRMFGTTIDVTERRVAEEALRTSEERLRQALTGASAGCWELESGTGALVWSRETYDLYGLDPDRGQPTLAEWQACVHPDDLPGLCAALADALSGRTSAYRVEVRVRHPRKGERWVLGLGHVKLAAGGAPARLMGISIDITDRKRAEENLREVDRRRNDFLGVLSHELRNPLNPILSNLFILDRAPPGGDQARHALAVINRQVRHLTRLVDDLLDVTRITSGRIRLQPARLDLADLVRRTIDDHRSLLASRELTVDLPQDPVWIRGDATRLAQVLGNLLSNAAKFTPEKGKVSISLGRAGDRAVFEVADTGLGLDPETLARLFVPFVQADRSLDRTRGGLGLGLALVKTLVEMHGGEVTARSEGPGRGACFTVQLPLDEESTPKSAGQRGAAGKGRKVLVIEDNKDSAESLIAALRLLGHDVAVAFDGAAGLSKVAEVRPEVVLCDIGLPGPLDGYAIARLLRQDPAHASIYRIALTGYAQPEDRKKAHAAGFDAHLAKPVDMDALVGLLEELPGPSYDPISSG
jgi:PAS domain S-box-containing protein